jgi:hypothetical protein
VADVCITVLPCKKKNPHVLELSKMKMTGKCTKHASSCLQWLIKVQLHEPDDDRRGHACPDGAGDLDIAFPYTCIDRLFPQALHCLKHAYLRPPN